MLKYLFIILLFLASTANAATYYIDNEDGSCNDSGDGSISTPWCNVSKANSTLTAGDTVYIRGSSDIENPQLYSFTDNAIAPDNSGTSNAARITYSVYTGEYVEFRGDASDDATHRGISLIYRDFVTVTGHHTKGLKITQFYKGIQIGPLNSGATDWSDSNEVAYCWIGFNSNPDWTPRPNPCHSCARYGARYTWIHDCVFEEIGTMEGTAVSGALDTGADSTPSSPSDYNKTYYQVVENCEFLKTGHHSYNIIGNYSIYRNNYSHNEAWYLYNEIYRSYRIGEATQNSDTGSTGMIIERNRTGHNALTYDGTGNSAFKMSIPEAIVRYNAFFNNYDYKMCYFTAQYEVTSDVIFFNNTFFYEQTGTDQAVGINNEPTGMVFKNNLHWETRGTQNDETDYYFFTYANLAAFISASNTVDHNFNDYYQVESIADPKFVDETLNDYDSWILPDLNLQASSPAIDQGTYLTTVASVTDADTVVLTDSRYFQDGKFGSASGIDTSKWPTGVSIQADYICFTSGTTVDFDHCVQIDAINYGTNTVDATSAHGASENWYVWLYKISDGAIVLSGNASDPGAYEYGVGGGSQASGAVITGGSLQ